MMARSTNRSNQRPDTLMQDRNTTSPNLLRRTAGPYIGSIAVILDATRTRPLDFNERTWKVAANMASIIRDLLRSRRTLSGPAPRFSNRILRGGRTLADIEHLERYSNAVKKAPKNVHEGTQSLTSPAGIRLH